MDIDQKQTPSDLRKKATKILIREEAIRTYLKKDIPKGKNNFCRFYFKGCCLFSAQECKFAHGINDLKFEKPDIEQFEKNPNLKDNNEKSAEGTEEVEQPSLMLEMDYKNLYEYQFVLEQKKEISKTFTQTEINSAKKVRQSIRELLTRDTQQGFMNMLYAEYNTRALKKDFVEDCYQSVGHKPLWKYILAKDFAYEAKVPSNNETMIVKQLAGELFDTFMEDSIIKIIKDKELLKELPIHPNVITKWYYQHLGPQDPFLPAHHIYLSSRKIKNIEEYLERLQNSEAFRTKLALECGRTLEEITDLSMFSNSSGEMKELIASIRSILLEVIEESEIGFLRYSVFENRVSERCAKRLQHFNNSMPQIRKLMAKMALEHNIYIMSFDGNPYLFSPAKFQKVNLSEIHPKIIEEFYKGCSPKERDLLAGTSLPKVDPEKFNVSVSDRQTEEFLSAELDLEKVVVVNSEKTLKEASEYFATVDTVSVDLEGTLCKEGLLELIQCASRTRIFVFDIYGLTRLAKEGNNNDLVLYQKTMAFLKSMIEDSKICKVFHDGRQDSLALHVFLNICVSNVFDTSAVHMLTEYLERYAKKNNNLSTDQEEQKTNANSNGNLILHLVEEVKLPGLNEVLELYKTTHGPNRLKQIMRKRVANTPLEHFLNRPIDREFLTYAARDVEDMIEVKDRIEQRLEDVLKVLISEFDSRMATILSQKVSKIFSKSGCEHKE